MATEADLKSEIARLTASINQHKTSAPQYGSGYGGRGRGSYRGGFAYSAHANRGAATRFANNKYVRPGVTPESTSSPGASTSTTALPNSKLVPSSSTFNFQSPSTPGIVSSATTKPPSTPTDTAATKDVVIGGVAFESSARSLVRKDLVKTKSVSSGEPPSSGHNPYPYTRKSGHMVAARRTYKPKSHRGRNMTLDNTRKSWREAKRQRYSSKPCPRFTITGACNRGLTCVYQHDPSKIAICWNFLQDTCPNSAKTCQLSHEPTPERTPLCLHFLNKGRCTRGGCPFPHVNVGKREGICRDFAVLGYCEKGLDCDKQHIRECPDFAENGTCSTKGCKLPHVIRANRGRKAPVNPAPDKAMDVDKPASPSTNPDSSLSTEVAPVYAEDGKLGDEYISLTFHESEDEESDEEGDSQEEEERSEEEDEDEDNGSEETDPKNSESE